jgi:hypothetical protein
MATYVAVFLIRVVLQWFSFLSGLNPLDKKLATREEQLLLKYYFCLCKLYSR